MIFNSIKELLSYFDKLLDANVKIGLIDLNKILTYNSINIDKTILIEGADDEFSLKSIEIDLEEKTVLTLHAPSWVKVLPAIYHDNIFLQNFLFGFQASDLKHQNIINQIEKQFDPSHTEFIDWLSSWVGIRFANEVDDRAKRRILHNLVRLYKIRGTKDYFIELIGYLSGVKVRIDDSQEAEVLHASLRRRNNSKRGSFFKIFIDEKLSSDLEEEKMKLQIIHDFVDAEKPINVNFRIEYPFGENDTENRKLKVMDMHYENYYDYDNFRGQS